MSSPLFLILDDSEAKIQVEKDALRAVNWPGDILVAMTTEEAEKILNQHEIAAAFIDYYVPSTNGPAFILQLIAKHPACKVILVTSANNPKNIAEAIDAGALGAVYTGSIDALSQLEHYALSWKAELETR